MIIMNLVLNLKMCNVIFNGWLHDYVYKYHNNEYGIRLKELYDKGIIKNENDFRKELNVLLNS